MQLLPHRADGVDVLAVSGPVTAEQVGSSVVALERPWRRRSRAALLDLRDVTRRAAGAGAALVRRVARGRPRPRTAALRHVDDRSTSPRQRVELVHGPTAPGQARRAVAECADRLGLLEVRDDLSLLVSELVTNAVRYGEPPVVLELETGADAVLVAVADGGPEAPQCRHAGEDAEGGRGLLLVDLLSSAHGVRPQARGKTVWASVPLPGRRTSG